MSKGLLHGQINNNAIHSRKQGSNMNRIKTIVALLLVVCVFLPLPAMAAEKEQREMKIGIIGAMKPEVDTLQENMQVTRRETKAGMEFAHQF